MKVLLSLLCLLASTTGYTHDVVLPLHTPWHCARCASWSNANSTTASYWDSASTRVRRPSLRHARKGSARTAGRGLLGKQLPQLRPGLDSIYFFIIFEALGSHFFYSTHFI